MGTDERLVAVYFRVLFGPDEKHVFQKVGKPPVLFGIVMLSAKRDQRRCRLVGLGIRYEQDLQLVVEFQVAILAIVVGTLVYDHRWRCGDLVLQHRLAAGKTCGE